MSYPKAVVRLPPPWGPEPRSVHVFGFDRGSKTRVVEGSEPTRWEVVSEPILWVWLRLGSPECGRRFEISKRDVVWVNTEAANKYGIGISLPVIGIGYGADEKIKAYKEEQKE